MVPVVDQCGRLRRRGKDLSRRDTETRDFGDVMARTRDDRRERRDGEKDASTARGFAARARAMVGDWRDGFVRSLEHATERQTVLQWLSLALVVTSALMLWKTLVLATQSESPVGRAQRKHGAGIAERGFALARKQTEADGDRRGGGV